MDPAVKKESRMRPYVFAIEAKPSLLGLKAALCALKLARVER